jgi:hypothetical protein
LDVYLWDDKTKLDPENIPKTKIADHGKVSQVLKRFLGSLRVKNFLENPRGEKAEENDLIDQCLKGVKIIKGDARGACTIVKCSSIVDLSNLPKEKNVVLCKKHIALSLDCCFKFAYFHCLFQCMLKTA